MLKVMKKRCNQCLFSNNKIVSDERREDILETCRERDCHFVCHKTEDTCCRGSYDHRSTNLIRIMSRLNGIQFVDEDEVVTDAFRDA